MQEQINSWLHLVLTIVFIWENETDTEFQLPIIGLPKIDINILSFKLANLGNKVEEQAYFCDSLMYLLSVGSWCSSSSDFSQTATCL